MINAECLFIGMRERLAKVSKDINVSIHEKTLKQVYSKNTLLDVIIDDRQIMLKRANRLHQ